MGSSISIEQRMQDLEDKFNGAIKNMQDDYSNTIGKYEKENSELKKQIESLKSINNSLHKNNENNETKTNEINKTINMKDLSKKQISLFVDKILSNKNMNISYIPDFVEKQIYKNIFDLLLQLMDHIFDNVHFNFIGHTISVNMEPNQEE